MAIENYPSGAITAAQITAAGGALITESITNGDTTHSPSGNAIYDNYGIPGIKRYVALMSQSGTGDPTAVVKENTVGVAVTWSRGGAGLYTSNTGNFTGLTAYSIAVFNENSGVFDAMKVSLNTDQAVIRTFANADLTNTADDVLNATLVELVIYP